jgi:hypothetical protein
VHEPYSGCPLGVVWVAKLFLTLKFMEDGLEGYYPRTELLYNLFIRLAQNDCRTVEGIPCTFPAGEHALDAMKIGIVLCRDLCGPDSASQIKLLGAL